MGKYEQKGVSFKLLFFNSGLNKYVIRKICRDSIIQDGHKKMLNLLYLLISVSKAEVSVQRYTLFQILES